MIYSPLRYVIRSNDLITRPASMKTRSQGRARLYVPRQPEIVAAGRVVDCKETQRSLPRRGENPAPVARALHTPSTGTTQLRSPLSPIPPGRHLRIVTIPRLIDHIGWNGSRFIGRDIRDGRQAFIMSQTADHDGREFSVGLRR